MTQAGLGPIGEEPTKPSDISRGVAGAEQLIAHLLLGESPPMLRLRSLIARLAPSSSAVLIEGPSGAGKELVAEALHLCSGRRGAFVPFNVCAIPEGMLEAALFGHVRGGYTGALGDSPGYLAEADGGTAFFDEISGLSMTAQPKLLRALESRSFRAVGAQRDRRSDFRMVAATNDELELLVGAGRFRADLLHRVRALVIRVPALADHMEDVPLLARHFARQARATGPVELDDEGVALLMEQPWPGNVRELRNAIEFAAVLADEPIIGRREISRALGQGGSRAEPGERALERQRLLAVLDACAWDTRHAASLLGIDRSNVYRRMHRAGLSRAMRRTF